MLYRFILLVVVAGLALMGCGDDDGGTNDNQNNQNNQNSQSVCGNGEMETGEICDDGEANSDVLPNACRTDCRFAYCGDGVVDNEEECDLANLQETDCTDLQSFNRGTLVCADTCVFDTSGCYECGNGVVEFDEVCDGTDLAGATCASEGQLPSGELSCTAECQIDSSACHLCGDGIRQGSEVCDGTDVGSETCDSQGYPSGTLGCGIGCLFDFDECDSCDSIQDLLDQTGCLATEACTIASGGNPGCLPAGTVPPYQECGSGLGDCQAGAVCYPVNGVDFLCLPFCDSQLLSGCPGGGICAASLVLPVGEVGVCFDTDACDPVYSTGCLTGEACYPIGLNGETTCLPAGTGSAGDTCQNYFNCDSGLTCDIGVCKEICYTNADCSSSTCQDIGTVIPGNNTVGFCP